MEQATDSKETRQSDYHHESVITLNGASSHAKLWTLDAIRAKQIQGKVRLQDLFADAPTTTLPKLETVQASRPPPS